MLHLDRSQLEVALAKRGLTLSQLCRKAGISRQSVYAMLAGRSIYNSSFLKILRVLGPDASEITVLESPLKRLSARMPEGVRKAALLLYEHAMSFGATLVLFGSRATSRARAGSDWDFGLYYPSRVPSAALAQLKPKAQDLAFPIGLDVVCLNRAPSWFWEALRGESVLLCGDMPPLLRESA